ncbi:MAG: cytidine deaminase [Chitinophagales bacterium]
MTEKEIKFSLRVYDAPAELNAEDKALMQQAIDALQNAYAPYSKFRVGAAVLLQNGKVVTGTNQENASYPVGICAEGTALSTASSLYPNVAIKKIAITVKSETHVVDHPVAPCGICRQRILEYENRYNSPIEIIIMGEQGKIYSINTVKDILPLYFSKSDL